MNSHTVDMQHKVTTPQYSPPPETKGAEPASPEETKAELREAIRGSNEILATARTKLTLFPDTVTVDRAKLTVTKRTFVSMAEIMSIRIEDILNVTATVGPYFGTLKIVSRVMNEEDSYTVGKLTRDDAMRLKHVTQGYVIALQRGIDCSSLQTGELRTMLEKLGEDDHGNS